jgi:hypothetical protein
LRLDEELDEEKEKDAVELARLLSVNGDSNTDDAEG